MKSLLLFLSLAAANSLQAQFGALDPTFSSDGKLTISFTNDNAAAKAVVVQPDHKTIAAGSARQDGQNDFALSRFNADGTPDTGFNTTGKLLLDFFGLDDLCTAVALQSDGKIIAAGYTFTGEGFEFAMARFHANGSPDLDFGIDGRVTAQAGVTGFCQAVAVQPDGKILLAGYALSPDSLNNEFVVLRFHPDGWPDTDFGTDGKAVHGLEGSALVANSMTLQPDHKIILAGQRANDATLRWESAVMRLNADGSRDADFGNNGLVLTATPLLDNNLKAVVLQPDGKIVVAGYAGSGPSSNRFMLTRYLADGAPDAGFADNGMLLSAIGANNNYAQGLAITASRIIAGGTLSQDGQSFFAVAAYHFDGSRDLSFGANGTATAASGQFDSMAGLSLAPDGKIACAGATVINNISHFALARFQAASTLGTEKNTFGKEFSVYPNPIGSNSKLRFHLDAAEAVWADLLDVSGHIVGIVLSGQTCAAGDHELPLLMAEKLPSGVYHLVLRSRSGNAVLKLLR